MISRLTLVRQHSREPWRRMISSSRSNNGGASSTTTPPPGTGEVTASTTTAAALNSARPETRVALKLLDVNVAAENDNRLMELIRGRVPSAAPGLGSGLEDIENELRGEIASSLGRTEHSLKIALAHLEVATKACDECQPGSDEEFSLVETFNKLFIKAHDARQALIIQRQAAGFQLDNYKLVVQAFPLPRKRRVRNQS
jgi:hypothetical protein